MSDFSSIPPYYNPPPPPRNYGVNPIWLLVAVMFGFLLPICACGVLMFTSLAGFSTFVNEVNKLSLEEPADIGSTPGIGIVELNGVIFQGEGIGAASDRMIRDIEWMENNDHVKAIVVMANSPGGDANASDVVWKRLSEVEKPVYVAIDGLCASGCYYIAMGADQDRLYATPNSLVGSIGVISTFFNVDELLEDIGVDVEIIATGENKDFGSLFRDMTEDEKAYWREQTGVIFENFLNRVELGRANHLNAGQVRELATGRVWSASIAKDLGLIDDLLYPQEVMDLAAQDVGLGDDYREIESPYQPTFFDLLFASTGTQFGSKLELPDTNDLTNMLQQSPIQYRYMGPYSGANEANP